MAYYLSMNGTSDNLKTPSIAFNEVILDFILLPIVGSTTDQYYIDARTGITNSYVFYRPTTPADLTSASSPWLLSGGAVYVDGVQKTNANSLGIPKNQRTTLRLVLNAVGTDDVCLFSNNTNSNKSNASVYRVTFKNAGVVVADYDMNSQTVQDQSGNGNHATLTGGTWVSDAAGVTHSGAASLQGVSTITASATLIPAAITGNASLQGVATLSAAATVTNNSVTGAATVQGIGTLTATGGLIRSSGANMQGVSTLSAFAAGLTVLGGASLTGVGWVMASGVSGANIARSVNLFASMVEAINLWGETVAQINLQGSWISPVTLLGSKPEPIALEGGLMTKLKQNFSMYAGDTPPLTFTMSDSTILSGATVKWSMRKGHVKGSQVLLKTSLNGGLSVSGSVVTVSLLNADTFSLEGQFYHEAEVTDVSGKVSTVLTGVVTIEPSGV